MPGRCGTLQQDHCNIAAAVHKSRDRRRQVSRQHRHSDAQVGITEPGFRSDNIQAPACGVQISSLFLTRTY